MYFDTPWYVVGGRDHEQTMLFYNIDSSGAFAYVSKNRFEKTDNLEQAVDWLEDLQKNFYNRIKTPEVFQLAIHNVNIDHIVSRNKKISEFVNSLSQDEKAVLKKKL